MAFAVPQSKKSIKQNRFEFTVDGEDFEIPLMQYVPVEAAEAFESGRNATAIILACDNDATKDAIRAMDTEQLEALLEAWQKASEVGPGESQAS